MPSLPWMLNLLPKVPKAKKSSFPGVLSSSPVPDNADWFCSNRHRRHARQDKGVKWIGLPGSERLLWLGRTTWHID